MRVSGNPTSGNNGRFYIHSDHPSAQLRTSLGSMGVLTKYSDGYIRTDSLTRYAPFGAYRTGGPNPLTDRGFTGQRENMSDLGLMYYNARFYVPSLGRFLSADTIVPDPQNPQSLNRYAYSFNSPLVYSDPSGHEPMWCSAEYGGGPACEPLVSFQGGRDNWTDEEMTIIRLAAYKVAFALKGRGTANSASEQFLAVYGNTVNFRKTGVTAGNLGEAISKNEIIVNEHTQVSITSATAGQMWAAHEMGHAFNYALHPNTTDKSAYGQGIIDLALEGIFVDGGRIAGNRTSSYANDNYYERTTDGYRTGPGGKNGPYVQNPGSFVSEDFADIFSNWTFNSFATDVYGEARYNFMDSHMTAWISLAVTNNQ